MSTPYRDPATGAVTYPVSAHVRVPGEILPRTYRLQDWSALAAFIDSDDFPAEAESLTAARSA